MTTQERIAMEAVATRFSATWETARDRTGPFITVAGTRIAVEIATLNPRGTGAGKTGELRLRFDKVATRLVERLQSTVGPAVPQGVTMLLTITAPIRLPSKTAAALEEKIRTVVARRSSLADSSATIYRNRVRMRCVRHGSRRAPKVIGFVHNADSDPLLLLNMTRQLIDKIVRGAGRRKPRPLGDRWLVVVSAGGRSRLDAYRYICSQLGLVADFKQVVVVFGDDPEPL